MSTPDTSGRIIALDILRGYFIFVIASIHLFYLPSFLGLFDGRGQLWFSDADGFFFISGLLIGITRHKDLQRAGLWAATTHTWARARTLFVATVVLTFLYTYLGRLLTIAGTPGVKTGLDTTSSWLDLLIRTLTLQYSYGWTDFLIYYVAFLVVTPLLLWLMSRRLWWAALALTLAAWIWHWSNISIPGQIVTFLLWQCPFFLGLLVGYYWNDVTAAVRRLAPAVRQRLYTAAIAAAAVIYVVSSIFVLGAEQVLKYPAEVPAALAPLAAVIAAPSQNTMYNRLFNDARGGLLRPIILIVVMAGLFALVRRYEEPILRFGGWLLVPFGRNSLYVYIIQGVLLFAIPLFIGPSSFLVNTTLDAFMTAVAWFAVRHRFLFKVIPR